MPTPILLKRSTVTGKIPLTTDLALGELALNTTDGKIYMKKSVGGVESVVQVSGVANAADLTGNTLSANVTASSLTSVGTLTSLTIGGAIVKSGTSGTGDIGQTGNKFGTVFATTFNGTATTAQYADLAEIYRSDADYTPGTVLIFGGDAEVTVTDETADTRVAGVVSTAPAYLMNSAVEGIAVALRGRVPVKVVGRVQKGDLLVTSAIPGHAVSVGREKHHGHAVFAKALEFKDTEYPDFIEAVIL